MQDEVLPARRVSKSREVTPAEFIESDSDDTKPLLSISPSPTPASPAASKKARLKKKLPEQQPDAGSARKRRKRVSQTPEPINVAAAATDAVANSSAGPQHKQESSSASVSAKTSRVSQQEDPGHSKVTTKVSRALSRSPAPKGHSNGKGRARSAHKTPTGISLKFELLHVSPVRMTSRAGPASCSEACHSIDPAT